MKTLDLEDTYRHYLERRGALGLDVHGNEVLVGLSQTESVEYVAVTDGSISSPLSSNFPNPQRFLDLADRHEAARPKCVEPFYQFLGTAFVSRSNFLKG